MKISLAMIVKNEENNLIECLNSVKDLVDEIVIVDTGSDDETKNIALKYTNKVYDFIWCNDFAKARNFSLEKCIGDWILVLDADEIIENFDKEKLTEFINAEPSRIGKIEIVSKFIKNDEISFSKSFISRFFKNGIFFEGNIHEQLDSTFERENIDIKVRHNGYFNTNKEERNIPLLLEAYKKNEDKYISYQLGKSFFTGNKYKEANFYFYYAYKSANKKESYLKDLVITYIYSCIEIKDFQRGLDLINENYEIYQNSSEFHFAEGIFYINLILSDINTYGEYLYLIENSYLKCLELGEREVDSVIGVGTFKAAYNLGVYYETLNNVEKANYYYKEAYEMGYKKAENRIK